MMTFAVKSVNSLPCHASTVLAHGFKSSAAPEKAQITFAGPVRFMSNFRRADHPAAESDRVSFPAGPPAVPPARSTMTI